MHALLIALLMVAANPAPQRLIPVAPAETLSVMIQGAGPTVAIVPGLLGGSFGFRHVAAALAKAGCTVVIIDPLGTGDSSRPDDADYSFTAQAARVAAALDTLGEQGTVLVVHAAGAAIGYRLALTRPDLVASLVSINGGPAEHLETPGVAAALSFAPVLKLFGADGKARGKLVDGLREASHDPAWVTEDVIDAYGADYREDLWGTLRMFQRMSRAKEPWPLQPALGDITAPVLLLRSAEQPQSIPDAHVAVLEESLQRLTIEHITGAGQYIHEERPEAVVAAIIGSVAEACGEAGVGADVRSACRH